MKFNPLTLPLQGVCLIEASAGTGKTYTLIILYIRLLLGLGKKNAYLRALDVKEILVVTFTQEVTNELRDRIRKSIHSLRIACERKENNNPLLSEINDFQLAIDRLFLAEKHIDEIAIFTIHGFCQKILNSNPIKSNMFFRYDFLEDESILYQEIIVDFWREYFYSLPIDIINIIQQYWKSPNDLLKELMPYIHNDMPVLLNFYNPNETIINRHVNIITKINNLKNKWNKTINEAQFIIENYDSGKRVYNKKNLTFWIKKINQWTKEFTINYQIPKELEYFKISKLRKVINNKFLNYSLFIEIEEIYQQVLSLRELIFNLALKNFHYSLKRKKNKNIKFGFSDLINQLDEALSKDKDNSFAKLIRSRYPAAIFDEFQDTDLKQYRIFSRIYNSKSESCLLLLGDPKQAIYTFRGADIFSYIYARKEIDIYYTLDINWRSSPGLINAINIFFKSLPVPFIFNEISFLPVNSAVNNINLQLIINGKTEPSLRIWFQSNKEIVTIKEYLKFMAYKCAVTIYNWLCLAKKNKAWLENRHQKHKTLKASDIVILVRNYKEAELICKELSILKIPFLYISNRVSNVFKTTEALEILWILQAVLNLKTMELRRVLATNLLGFDISTINFICNNECEWEAFIKDFNYYHLIWKKFGILSMLRQIIITYNVTQNLMSNENGTQRLNNILHIGELLQKTSIQLINEYALIQWLSSQIESSSLSTTDQRLRIENNNNYAIRVMTIHKSKGLEFPIVFLPFVTNFRLQKIPFFHDRQTYITHLDLKMSLENLRLAEEERLSEDLRLLYVGMTRSIYHCSIGIAPLIIKKNNKKNIHSDTHLSAPGYLIQQGVKGDINWLRYQLTLLINKSNNNIVIDEFIPVIEHQLLIEPIKSKNIKSLNSGMTHMFVRDLWRITSYTDLIQDKNSKIIHFQQEIKLNIKSKEHYKEKKIKLTPHTFPCNSLSGKFLHSLLRNIDFNKNINIQYFIDKMAKYSINKIWLPMIIKWIDKIIHIPLNNDLLSLSCLTIHNKCTELQFFLSIDTLLQSKNLDLLCKRFDSLSLKCPSLNFYEVRGILKGFIDLVFYWKGKYYLLDYKSNFLGENSLAYTLKAMKQEIINHRYDFQYQLYALALHRFLRHRLSDYRYSRDFGGVYYLFIRGINERNPTNGIYYHLPNETLIDEIDKLFIG